MAISPEIKIKLRQLLFPHYSSWSCNTSRRILNLGKINLKFLDMKLLQLVSYFKKDGGSFEEFRQSQSLDQGSEVIEIYMKKPLRLDGDIAFFAIENTEGRVEYTHENVEYSNLFDFYYFLDVIEDSNSNESLSNEEIAKILYDYAINDA